MSGVEIKQVGRDEEGLRLDRWFKAHYPSLTHGRLEKLLRTGQIRIDGARAKSKTRLKPGQKVRVPPLPSAQEFATSPSTAKLSRKDKSFIESLVIYRDDDVIALNKPPGLAVQGGSRTVRHVDALSAAFADRGGGKPRLVHRLDKATSGVLLLARNRRAAAEIAAALKRHEAQKIYWALVAGVPRLDRGDIDLSLAKSGGAGRERVGASRGNNAKRALTRYRTIEAIGQRLAWLALSPITGRTHQLRVHLAAIGHPIVGDLKYGGEQARQSGIEGGLFLHARSITLPHEGGVNLKISAPLPDHMNVVWSELGLGDGPDEPFAEEDE